MTPASFPPRAPAVALAIVAAHRWFLGAAAACVLAFGWMITYGTFRFIAADEFGNFYDHQAAAWLQGRWDVPEPALGGEAFVFEGKVYGYFGPTPALQRLPFALLGFGFGQLTRLLMTLDYAVILLASYALLLLAHRTRAAPAPLPAWLAVLFTVNVGLGSMIFFLGSRAYVYHEAILCGLACALVAVYAALRYLAAPAARWWLASLAAGIVAVQARAPVGLFALCTLGCVAVAHLRSAPLRHVAVGASAALGIFSFNAVSYLKFRTFEGCPLRYNVQYPPAALAVLEHKNFHLSNLRFNTDAYLLRPVFSVAPRFPYLYREYVDRREYPESRMAYRDQTLAMPWSMPGLFWLAAAGGLFGAAVVPSFRRPVAVLAVAAIPPALAMLTAVSVTQRYEADFCPALVAVAAFGAAALPALRGFAGHLAAATFSLLALLGVAVVFALTIHHQREHVWGAPAEARAEYQRWRATLDRFSGLPATPDRSSR